MPKYTHFPSREQPFNSRMIEYLWKLKGIFGQGNVIRMWVPFRQTTEFVTISQLSTDII